MSSGYYLKISTQVVGNALSNIIAEVNEAQSIFDVDKNDRNAALSALLGISHIKSVFEEAWKATQLMDTFDMESDYKNNMYNKNRSILKNLCNQLGVSTSSHTPISSSASISQNWSTSATRSNPSTTRSEAQNRQTTSINNNNPPKSNEGLLWSDDKALFILIVIICVIGLIICLSLGI